MKEMRLFLVGVVLLACFVSFVVAEVNESNVTDVNETVVDLNESLSNEDEAEQADLEVEDLEVVDDLVVDDVLMGDLAFDGYDSGEPEAVVEKKSPLDRVVSYINGKSSKVVSYVSRGVDRINEVHENLFLVIIIILGVLLLFVYSIFFDYSSSEKCFSKASSLHRKATIAHVNGNYARAKKLYGESYLFREKGEEKVSGGADESAI